MAVVPAWQVGLISNFYDSMTGHGQSKVGRTSEQLDLVKMSLPISGGVISDF